MERRPQAHNRRGGNGIRALPRVSRAQNMMVSRLMAAVGLNYLHQGEYRLAADNFAKVSFESSNSFNEVSACDAISARTLLGRY